MNLVEQVRQLRQVVQKTDFQNAENDREDLLEQTRALLRDLERPDNVVERIGYQLMESVLVNIAIKMGLFKAINAAPNSSVVELADTCQADPVLMGRLLRGLGSFGVVEPRETNHYGPTSISHTFADQKNEVAMVTCLEFLAPGWLALPQYLQERKWKNPTSSVDSSLAKGWKAEPGSTLWTILGASGVQAEFWEYMANFNEGHRQWTDFYPIEERLGLGLSQDPQSVVMVDVGGGLGHQAAGLKSRFPSLAGRYIVQDISIPPPEKQLEGVEYMIHDFTKEQPVKGARLYYLRYVPHDWPQDFNVQLLSRLREAMEPGYSKLIVNEWVVPDVGMSRFMAAMDINLMSVSGGMERTEALHREYIEKSGLKITNIFYPGDRISEAVIEAELA